MREERLREGLHALLDGYQARLEVPCQHAPDALGLLLDRLGLELRERLAARPLDLEADGPLVDGLVRHAQADDEAGVRERDTRPTDVGGVGLLAEREARRAVQGEQLADLGLGLLDRHARRLVGHQNIASDFCAGAASASPPRIWPTVVTSWSTRFSSSSTRSRRVSTDGPRRAPALGGGAAPGAPLG